MKMTRSVLGVYLSFLCAGFSLSTAHGEEIVQGLPPGPNQSNAGKGYGFTPKGYVVPRVSSTDAPLRHRNAKSCGQYLSLCERSCSERGSLFKFQCIGQEFQPFDDHFRCQCGDDAFQHVAKKEERKPDLKAATKEPAK
jgi:hypothetical protein